MFESLSDRLGGIFDGLTGRGALSDKDVSAALREVRRALIEADVALDVVRYFTDRVREKAVGAEVCSSIKPGQMVVKIVHDELVDMLGSDGAADRSQRARAGRHHDGRPAGLGQDDDLRQDRQAPYRAEPQEGADGLARYAPAGRAGAVAPARRADRRRHAADHRRPDAGRHRGARGAGGQARRLRRRHPRHRRPHAYRRAADGRDGRHQGQGPPARNPAGRRFADRPGRGQPRAEFRRAASASPASC